MKFLFFDIKLPDIFAVYVFRICDYQKVRYILKSLSRLPIPLTFVIHVDLDRFGMLCLCILYIYIYIYI
jgi:hypothetical protein